jgi:hypothetical protein
MNNISVFQKWKNHIATFLIEKNAKYKKKLALLKILRLNAE